MPLILQLAFLFTSFSSLFVCPFFPFSLLSPGKRAMGKIVWEKNSAKGISVQTPFPGRRGVRSVGLHSITYIFLPFFLPFFLLIPPSQTRYFASPALPGRQNWNPMRVNGESQLIPSTQNCNKRCITADAQ